MFPVKKELLPLLVQICVHVFTFKEPPNICSRQLSNFLPVFGNQISIDISCELSARGEIISSLIFPLYQAAAVMIGALTLCLLVSSADNLCK